MFPMMYCNVTGTTVMFTVLVTVYGVLSVTVNVKVLTPGVDSPVMVVVKLAGVVIVAAVPAVWLHVVDVIVPAPGVTVPVRLAVVVGNTID